MSRSARRIILVAETYAPDGQAAGRFARATGVLKRIARRLESQGVDWTVADPVAGTPPPPVRHGPGKARAAAPGLLVGPGLRRIEAGLPAGTIRDTISARRYPSLR